MPTPTTCGRDGSCCVVTDSVMTLGMSPCLRMRWLGMALFLHVTSIASCSGPVRSTWQTPPAPPPDFALQFVVKGVVWSDNPLRQTSHYVLEPNRHLRVAIGPYMTAQAYARHQQAISRTAFNRVIEHVLSNHLMAEPTSPGAERDVTGRDDPDTVRYHVAITAYGRTHRYITTPAESPPTVQLLHMLATIAGRQTGANQ